MADGWGDIQLAFSHLDGATKIEQHVSGVGSEKRRASRGSRSPEHCDWTSPSQARGAVVAALSLFPSGSAECSVLGKPPTPSYRLVLGPSDAFAPGLATPGQPMGEAARPSSASGILGPVRSPCLAPALARRKRGAPIRPTPFVHSSSCR